MERIHNEDATTAGLQALVPRNDSSSDIKEKQNDSRTTSVEIADEKVAEPEYRNGVPVIKTGRDISHFVVDIRDDGDEALTFRSILLGTVFACMGAALSQVSTHSSLQDQITLPSLFLTWLRVLPRPEENYHGE
jgi:hypothetical protein